MKRLAFSYVRFSARSQRHGTSLKRQNDMVAAWLVHNPDYELSPLRFEDLGRSGYSGAHLENAFGRLLAAVETGAIPNGSTILIEAIDRAGRMEPMDMLPLVSKIVKAGVDIVTLDDGIRYDRQSANSNHLFLLVAKVQQAYNYSENLSRRVLAAYEKKREVARAGFAVGRRTPLWLNSEWPNGRTSPPVVTLREEIAPYVAQAFEDYAAGLGERRILTRLRAQHEEFKKVSFSTIKRWLKNPVAVGRWNDIEDVYPPVVSKELWFRVQKKLNDVSRPKSSSSKDILSGLVKCARCGKNYCTTGASETRAFSMKCITRHHFGDGPDGCSNKRSIPYAVFDYIRSQTAHAALVRAARSKTLSQSEKRLIEIDGQLGELHKQSERAAEGLLTYGMLPAIKAVLDRVSDSIRALEQERALLKATPVEATLSDMIDEEDMLLDDDPERLSALLKSVGYEVLVDDRTITVNEQSVFNSHPRQTYRFLGTDRVKGLYNVVENEEKLLGLPNLHSKVQKAEIDAYYAEEARYESGELERTVMHWNPATEQFDHVSGPPPKQTSE